ncbi:MAG TPA: glutathione S-transferase family protein [Alphaproteobacteria bacterium]|jgi:glutathione S-transferase
MSLTLYEGAVSPNARKVRLVAAELDLPLRRVSLSFAKGDMRSPEYLAKNPNGTIPTLEDDGLVLWESAAIMRYLASKRPERGLVPADPRGRALLDQWLFWWTAQPEAALMRLVSERLIKPFLGQPGNDAAIIGDVEAVLRRFLPVLDRQLAERDFIVGQLSVVDFAAGAWLDVAPDTLRVDIAPYDSIAAWLSRLRAKPYWANA